MRTRRPSRKETHEQNSHRHLRIHSLAYCNCASIPRTGAIEGRRAAAASRISGVSGLRRILCPRAETRSFQGILDRSHCARGSFDYSWRRQLFPPQCTAGADAAMTARPNHALPPRRTALAVPATRNGSCHQPGPIEPHPLVRS